MTEQNLTTGASLTWITALGLGAILGALALVDRSSGERISLLLDQRGPAWCMALGGYALIALSARGESTFTKHALSAKVTGTLALLSWTYHLLILKLPWLTGSVMPSQRLEVATAMLSRSVESLPLCAFGELLASAVLFAHATLWLLHAAGAQGWLPPAPTPSLGRFAVIAAGLALYCASAATVLCLATGRL